MIAHWDIRNKKFVIVTGTLNIVLLKLALLFVSNLLFTLIAEKL